MCRSSWGRAHVYRVRSDDSGDDDTLQRNWFYEVSETESEAERVRDAEEGAERSRGVCVWWLEQVEAQDAPAPHTLLHCRRCLSTKYISARRQTHAHRQHFTPKTTRIKHFNL